MAANWLQILKNYIGYEGAASLADKLTAARAALLDQITAARLGELDAANLPADVDTMLTRLSAPRAGYLDNINNDQLPQITAARLGYIDLLADAGVGLAAIEALVDDLETAIGAIEGATTLHDKLTAARAALLDQITAARLGELDAANIPTDIDTLLTRVTAAVALASVCTEARLAELGAANLPADIDTLLARVTAAVALASVCTEARLAELDAANMPADIDTIKSAIGGPTGAFNEQADAAVDITAILASETNVFDLSVAATRYVVRSLRLKCADPGANTVSVRLYELINDVSTVVDTFAIDTSNFATHHSLMDMFGVSHLAGDSLKITVQASAGGPYAVTGQYSHGKTNV